jgi:VCBS repeat-containing protein
LTTPANQRFLDLDTFTDAITGVTFLAITNFTTGRVHIYSIDGNNNVFAERTFSAQAPNGTQVSRIVIDENRFIHLNYGPASGASSEVRSFCFAGVQVAAQILYPANNNGWLNGIDYRNGVIYTPYCNAQATVQNDPVYCLNFTPPAANSATLDINGATTSTTGVPVVIPINVIGQQPSVANPYIVNIVRQSPAQTIQLTLTTPPYQYIDNYINASGSYTYQIQSATTQQVVCEELSWQGTFTVTVADSTIGGDRTRGRERWRLRKNFNGTKEKATIAQKIDYTNKAINDENTNSINLYPNPVTQSLNLDMKTVGTYQVTVYDVMGTILLKQEVKDAQNATLNVSQLPTGVYLVHTVSADGKIAISRFVKQ